MIRRKVLAMLPAAVLVAVSDFGVGAAPCNTSCVHDHQCQDGDRCLSGTCRGCSPNRNLVVNARGKAFCCKRSGRRCTAAAVVCR